MEKVNTVSSVKKDSPFVLKQEKKDALPRSSVSTRAIVRFWLIGGCFVFLGYLFFESLEMVYLILAALIIGISMEGIILSLEKRIKYRGVAIALGYLLLLIFVFSGIVFIIPFAVTQLSSVASRLTEALIQIKNFIVANPRPEAITQISWLPDVLKNYFLKSWADFDWNDQSFQATALSWLNAILDSSTTYLQKASAWLFSFMGNFFVGIGKIVIVFTLAVFFTIEKKYVVNLLSHASNPEKKQENRTRIDNIYTKLSIRLKARVLLSLFVSLVLYILLLILKLFGIDIPSIFTLSLLAGLLDIVPYVGPIFAFIPLVILAWVYNGFWAMVIVGIGFYFIQWLQNNVVQPFLMKKKLGVNSVLILLCTLLGATIMGVRGAILSVPIAVLISLFIDEK